jgi:hypothetical protein
MAYSLNRLEYRYGFTVRLFKSFDVERTIP